MPIRRRLGARGRDPRITLDHPRLHAGRYRGPADLRIGALATRLNPDDFSEDNLMRLAELLFGPLGR